MEDRYLYKAKTTSKKGEFNNVRVTGNLIVSNGKYYIHPINNVVNVENEIGRIIVMHEVIPDTICQCTGLKDKNGKRIWENDIVKINNSKVNTLITFRNFEIICTIPNKKYYKHRLEHTTEYEVVGNIFDNPELLESEG